MPDRKAGGIASGNRTKGEHHATVTGNWQVMAGGKRVLFSNRMYERFSDVKSGIVATINVCENSGSVTDKAMLEGAKVMMQVLDGYPSFAALAAHPKRITG